MGVLTQLAEEILVSARRVDAYNAHRNLAPTSFENDTMWGLPPDVEAARKTIIDSTQTLKWLALGPVGLFKEILCSFTDLASLRAICTYNIAHYVPIQGSTTFARIARGCGLSEPLVRRFIRHGETNHIFTETDGRVHHTAASYMLVRDPECLAMIGASIEEFAVPSSRIMDAQIAFPNSEEPNETAYNVQNETQLPFLKFLAQDPERARRFRAAMHFFTRGDSWRIEHVTSGFDWDSLDRRPHALVVDFTGGYGHIAQKLATVTQNIQFIVQDAPNTAETGRWLLPARFRNRVEFMDHDIFTQQPIKSADVYFFRWTFHNWSDKYAVQILRNLVPAMNRDSMILLHEFVLPDGPETRLTEKFGRDIDIIQLTLFNGCERTASDWERLFETADPRLVLKGVTTPPGSLMSFLEVSLRP